MFFWTHLVFSTESLRLLLEWRRCRGAVNRGAVPDQTAAVQFQQMRHTPTLNEKVLVVLFV